MGVALICDGPDCSEIAKTADEATKWWRVERQGCAWDGTIPVAFGGLTEILFPRFEDGEEVEEETVMTEEELPPLTVHFHSTGCLMRWAELGSLLED